MKGELRTKSNRVLLDLTDNILKRCKQENIEIRVLGGIAVFLKCPKHQEFINKYRKPFLDIDLITTKYYIEEIEKLFNDLGFEQNKNFKIHFGYQRRVFYTPQNITIEVYLGNLHLCQEIKISDRLLLDYPTISVTDLLLSKIQRIDLDFKDIFDISILLIEYDFCREGSERINLEYISELCSRNWRWWKTFKINIKKLYNNKLVIINNKNNFNTKLKKIEDAIDSKKKSIKWKLRNIIGGKLNWYNNVENSV